VTPCASSGEKYTLAGCSHLVDVGPLVGRFPFSWG
jgi:hypothetical protein